MQEILAEIIADGFTEDEASYFDIMADCVSALLNDAARAGDVDEISGAPDRYLEEQHGLGPPGLWGPDGPNIIPSVARHKFLDMCGGGWDHASCPRRRSRCRSPTTIGRRC